MPTASDPSLPGPRALTSLHPVSLPAQPLVNAPLEPGVWIDIDPAAQMEGTWESPRGRVIDIRAQVTTPGAWFGLHVDLPDALDLGAAGYVGFVARSTAARPFIYRACVRSGTEDGFVDTFFERDILSQSIVGDHCDLLVPAHHTGLSAQALWRQFILFLPAHHDITWSLQDLRVFVL